MPTTDRPAMPWAALHAALTATEPTRLIGHVTGIVGLTVQARGPAVSLGELCRLYPRSGEPVLAEVVGFRDGHVLLMPIGDRDGLGPGCEVEALGHALRVPVGPQLIGRVLDGLGRPLDGRGPLSAESYRLAAGHAPPPLRRRPVCEPLATGVRALDGLLTVGRGQRIGLFAGSGVGKSTLLGMIAKHSAADVNVVALIGERGREVLEFLERDLGPDGLARSVVIVATADEPAVVRLKAGFVATAIAEQFRDEGRNVMLMMDSLTRLCLAQREIGLAVGEPPATRGYPPSVFAMLPQLLERAGNSENGTLTGVYTVLVEGDDMNEPVADAVRGILDGHVVLSRDLATQGHFPAIDVLESISRVMPAVVSSAHMEQATAVRRVLATMRSAQDLLDIGAYEPGANPAIDFARAHIDAVHAFLRQDAGQATPFAEGLEWLSRLFVKEGEAA